MNMLTILLLFIHCKYLGKLLIVLQQFKRTCLNNEANNFVGFHSTRCIHVYILVLTIITIIKRFTIVL